MKIAVIGCGYWGKNLVRNFNKLGVLHTVCDIDESLLQEGSKMAGNRCFITTNYQEVLSNPNIDGVVIATPNDTHYDLAKQALLAGKDVLVEKPFTLCVDEAEELVRLSSAEHRVLMVGYLMLYHPAVRFLKGYIRDGKLGEIYYLYSTRVNLGQIRSGEDVLWRLAPHDIAMFIHLLDETPFVLSAQGFSYIQPNLNDVVFATFSLGKAVAHIQVSWLDPHKTRQLTIVGSDKMAVFDDTKADDKVRIYDKGVEMSDLSVRSEGVYSPLLKNKEPLAVECAEFISCIETRHPPLSDARLGLEVTKVLDAVSKKIERGQK